ncbi:hypothetical protein F2P81_025406 [Scophthalmus maximus]|uniref:Uncharacterized protein n=1 Tax=Scophthalmus maximus TaxID=52904 RepID=A0A6A4RT09_SCOMX|nr:hypothetical protein F2P81_025406 [Scophthalmus maximus]
MGNGAVFRTVSLIDVFSLSSLQIFAHWSLRLRNDPACFKSAVVIPGPEKSDVVSLNDDRPAALTSVMKMLKRDCSVFIYPMLDMDVLQFACRLRIAVACQQSIVLLVLEV